LEKNVEKQYVIKNLRHIGVKKGEMYVNKQCWHVLNDVIYASIHYTTIIEKVQAMLKI
jgi:hypothetical protein